MTLHTEIPPEPSLFRQKWSLAPGTIFLNHGSFGACPKPVLALQARLRRQMEAEPVQFLWRRYEERLEPSRVVLAEFIGARAKDIAFVTNATTGVNAVIGSIRLRAGDELLTTNLDYNACRNVIFEHARQARARVVVAPVPFPLRNAGEVLDAVMGVVTPRTRLALLDHVTSNSAMVLPTRELIDQLEARGVTTLVDGAHAPGMLPLDLAKLNPGYYTGNLHKWVCAPKGAAFLWVREDKQAGVQPAIISHGNNTRRAGYGPFQDRFDWGGTFDPTAWMCVGEAIQWMGNLLPGGWRQLRTKNHQLAVRARKRLCQRLQVDMPCPESMLGAMASIPLPQRFQGCGKTGKIDPEQLRLYDQFRIEVPFVRVGEPERRYFRISSQIYNSLSEYDYLGRALETVTTKGS